MGSDGILPPVDVGKRSAPGGAGRRLTAQNAVAPAPTDLLKRGGAALTSAPVFDLDGDGVVSEWEMNHAATKSVKQTTTIRTQKRWLGFGAILLGMSVAANFGMTWYAVEQGKTTGTHTEAGHQVLTDREGHPLRVDRTTDTLELSSTLPDALFDKMTQLTVHGEMGTITMQRSAWARYTEPHSRHGSVVVLYTPIGSVEFDGVVMHFTEQVDGAFARAGFVTKENSRRRRSGNAHSRRIRGLADIRGTFSFLTDLDTAEGSLSVEGARAHTLKDMLAKDIVYLQEVTHIACSAVGCDGKKGDGAGRPDKSYRTRLPVKHWSTGKPIEEGKGQSDYITRVKNIVLRRGADVTGSNRKLHWYSETYVKEAGDDAWFVEIGNKDRRSTYTERLRAAPRPVPVAIDTEKFYCDENAPYPHPFGDSPLPFSQRRAEDDPTFDGAADAVVSWVDEVYHPDGTLVDAFVVHAPDAVDPTGHQDPMNAAWIKKEGFLFYEINDGEGRPTRLYGLDIISEMVQSYTYMYGTSNKKFTMADFFEDVEGKGEYDSSDGSQWGGFKARAENFFDNSKSGRWSYKETGGRSQIGKSLGASEYFFDIEGSARGIETCWKATDGYQKGLFSHGPHGQVSFPSIDFTADNSGFQADLAAAKAALPTSSKATRSLLETQATRAQAFIDVVACEEKLQVGIGSADRFPVCKAYGRNWDTFDVLTNPELKALDAPPDLESHSQAEPFVRKDFKFKDARHSARRRSDTSVRAVNSVCGEAVEEKDMPKDYTSGVDSAGFCEGYAFEFPDKVVREATGGEEYLEFGKKDCWALETCADFPNTGDTSDTVKMSQVFHGKAVGPKIFHICAPSVAANLAVSQSTCPTNKFQTTFTGGIEIGLTCGVSEKKFGVEVTAECAGFLTGAVTFPPPTLDLGASFGCEIGVEAPVGASVSVKGTITGGITGIAMSCDNRQKPSAFLKFDGTVTLKAGLIVMEGAVGTQLLGPEPIHAGPFDPSGSDLWDGKLPWAVHCPDVDLFESAGSSSPSSSPAVPECADDQFLDFFNKVCVDCCTGCRDGYWKSAACTREKDIECTKKRDCDGGATTYDAGLDENGDRACASCTNCFAEHKIEVTACSANADAVCQSCEPHQFIGNNACVDRKVCDASGEYDANYHNQHQDAICRPCYSKKFHHGNPGESCSKWKKIGASGIPWQFNNHCDWDEKVITECSPTTNRVCGSDSVIHEACEKLDGSECMGLSNKEANDCLSVGMGDMGGKRGRRHGP